MYDHVDVQCCAAAYCLPERSVRSEYLLELGSRILRGCAYGSSPSGAHLYVCACICACTAVVMCSPSGVHIVVSSCMRAYTAFGMYGPSGVLVVQK